MRDLAIFLPSLLPGGVQRMFVQLARHFAEIEGLSVDMVLGEAKGPHLAEVPASVRVIDLKSPRLLGAVRGLTNYLAGERPAALLTGMPHSNIVAVWARKRARVSTRVVISEHSLIRDAVRSGGGAAWRAVPWLARRYYPRADAIVAVSREAARQVASMARLPQERITVIYNAALSGETARKMAEPVSHPWFEPGAPSVVLSVGRLVVMKDFPTLVRAFARVRTKRQARLMILGEGDQRPLLESLRTELGLGDDVALPGHVANPYPYLPRAGAFVMSSSTEGFGNALVEAMSAGTPVVATRCGGPEEILDEGRFGPLVPVGSDEQMACAIESMLDRPTPPDLLKRRAAEFSVSAIAPKYRECLGLRRPVPTPECQPAERPLG